MGKSLFIIQGKMEFAMKSTDKKPRCWEIRDCSPILYLNCSAFKQSDVPCWNLSDTQCSKLSETPKTCDLCEVFIRYHRHEHPSSRRSPEEE